MYASGVCGWAEQCHSVPSPLVGEGQGEGYNTHGICFMLWPINAASHRLRVCGGDEPRAQCSSPPLSLSLPHKGGGNRGARTFATHAMCPRTNFQRCVHALGDPDL